MFWDLLKQSIIIQGIIALACVGAVIYLYVMGKPVPQELITLVMLVMGFYFGSKSQALIQGRER